MVAWRQSDSTIRLAIDNEVGNRNPSRMAKTSATGILIKLCSQILELTAFKKPFESLMIAPKPIEVQSGFHTASTFNFNFFDRGQIHFRDWMREVIGFKGRLGLIANRSSLIIFNVFQNLFDLQRNIWTVFVDSILDSL